MPGEMFTSMVIVEAWMPCTAAPYVFTNIIIQNCAMCIVGRFRHLQTMQVKNHGTKLRFFIEFVKKHFFTLFKYFIFALGNFYKLGRDDLYTPNQWWIFRTHRIKNRALFNLPLKVKLICL
jgi:hypothetical protein